MAKIRSKFGEQQLVMVNYACGLNQSETGKYFEEIIIDHIVDNPGGPGTPLYGLYRYVRPQRVWFFSRFGHK